MKFENRYMSDEIQWGFDNLSLYNFKQEWRQDEIILKDVNKNLRKKKKKDAVHKVNKFFCHRQTSCNKGQ